MQVRSRGRSCGVNYSVCAGYRILDIGYWILGVGWLKRVLYAHAEPFQRLFKYWRPTSVR
jgi:hypothetical protein